MITVVQKSGVILWFTLCVLLAGCNKKPAIDRINFQLLYNGEPVDCESNLLVGDTNWRISALMFYISDLHYQGYVAKFDYPGDGSGRVALLGSRCEGGGVWSKALSWAQSAEDQAPPEHSLVFTLGVPFELNHRNPLLAKAPLDDSGMFWTWQLGYKFMRLDASSQTRDQHWALHFGSLGCEAASAMRAPAQPCQRPNQIPILIPQFDPDQPISLHLDRILSPAVIGQENCMGDPEDSACQSVFNALAQTRPELAVFGQLHK